jgi:hypothetical protein
LSTLHNKQTTFTVLVARLITDLTRKGYLVTFGESYRPPETAKLYEDQGRGIQNSLHTKRLAIDLNLFLNGEYLTRTDEYKVAGELWEGYSIGDVRCSWGGRFQDGNHFSIEHNGVK